MAPSGKLYQVKGICYPPPLLHRPLRPTNPCRAGVDWDQFLGPAQCEPYSKNRFAYNWHWFWDTGNGDIGNQGIHEMDIGMWGLNRTDWPTIGDVHRRQIRLAGRSGDAQHAADLVPFRRRGI